MHSEIGRLDVTSAPLPPAATAARPPGAPRDTADVIPASPPPEVLAEVDAAWERAAQLAAQNRELHFELDAASGRLVIEVRTLDGDVLRTIPPSRALDVIVGEAP